MVPMTLYALVTSFVLVTSYALIVTSFALVTSYALIVTSFALVTSYALIVTSYTLVIVIIKTIRGIGSCPNSIVDVRSLKTSTILFIYRVKARKT